MLAQSQTLLRQQESLREIIESISSELALRPLLDLIMGHACRLLGAENGTIGLIDEQRNVVITEAAYKMPDTELGAAFAPGEGLYGKVWETGEPVILQRYDNLARPVYTDLLDYTVIGAPILWRNQMIGVFGLGSPPPRQFSTDDVELLTLLARHAAIAIVNARLYASAQRRNERIAIIEQISRQIGSMLNLDQILQAALGLLDAHLNYSNVVLLLLDPVDPETLVMRARRGIYTDFAPNEYRQSIHQGIIGEAARSQQPLLIADVQRDPRYLRVPGVENIQAELAIPLLVGDRLIGVLNIESTQAIPIDSVGDLEIIADQLSIAIENARRYEAEKRRTERLELIARIGQHIVSQLDPDELFATTALELHQRLGYDHVALFLVDPVAPTWLVQRARASRWPHSEAVGYRQSIEQGVLGLTARSRTPQIINDVWSDPHYIHIPGADDLRCELAVPILLGNRLMGVLDVAQSRRFVEEDVTALQIIADQLAVATDQAYLFADLHRVLDEAKLLYATSQRISIALDVHDVVQAYLEQVAARGRYACSVALYEFDQHGERMGVWVYGRWTPADGLQSSMHVRVPYSRDALDTSLDAGETVRIHNVHTDPRVSQSLRDIQTQDKRPALAMIPLIARGLRIGLVILAYPGVYIWQDSDLHSYQITAAQLATAIESRQQQALLGEHNQQIAVMEERRRLARELHDSVTQHIFSITLIAQSIGAAWRRSTAEGEHRVQRLLELSQVALAEMRALLQELRPPEPMASVQNPLPGIFRIAQEGLVAALQHHVRQLQQDGLQIDVETQGYPRLAIEREQMLYRIVQEALNNVVKHAQATRVLIKLSEEGYNIRLTIQDNGVGFAVNVQPQPQTDTPRGIGLSTMQERATALGGEFRLNSVPGLGVKIEVIAPKIE